MGNLGKRDSIRVFILDTVQEQDHFHQDAELLYILEGSMNIDVNRHTLKLNKEDVLMVNANETYQYQATDDILFAKLVIPSQLISSLMQSADIVFWCDSTRKKDERYAELRGLLRQLLNRYLSVRDHGEDFGYYALCYQILDLLTTHFLLRITDREGADEKDRFEERIVQINNYIQANYSKPISSRDLAEKLYLSQGYLSRFFKKNYGMSFAEYLTRIRLYHAMEELLYSAEPITRIAYNMGFPNTAAFNKIFKETYGETPSAMRKKLKQQEKASEKSEKQAIAQGRLEEYLRTEGAGKEPSGNAEQREEVCDIRESEELRNYWGQTINMGAAADLLRSEVREHILLLADSLKFKYIRFWNLFSKDMLLHLRSESRDYNFSKLDQILDFLVAHGLKPHIELGIKPRRLYRNVQNAIVEEAADEDFMEAEQWKDFLPAMMRHLLWRYRRSELNTWRMELWFQESKWGDARAEGNYFRAFSHAYAIIKRYAENLEVGGCGMRGDYIDYEDFNMNFLRAWKKQACQPDFISMGYYAYERGDIRGDRYSKRSTDNNGLYHRIESMRSLLRDAGWEQTKFYLTEWNLSISDRNYINDSCFKGAYILKNVIDNYGNVDMLTYFWGSDWVSEHYDSSGLLHGGGGLLTKDTVMKPAGYAFRFLSRLYPYYAGRGKNYMVTTDRHDAYSIVCHNQRELNYNYYLSQEDKIQKEHIWKYFRDQNALRLTLRLEGVVSGFYQIKTYQINERDGDVLRIWGEIGYEKELSRRDVEYLQRVCGPRLTIRTVEIKGEELTLPLELMANEIRFIRIRKLM